MKIIDLTNSENVKVNKSKEYLLTSSQKNLIRKIDEENVYLLAPNFMRYSRMLSSEKYKECLVDFMRNMGFWKNLILNIENVWMLAPVSGIFWPAVMEMLIVDLSSIKRNENVVLNAGLVDLALHSGREDLIEKAIRLAKVSTNGKVGIWTKNINLLFSKCDFDKLGIDFIITPFNEFGAGMRVDKEIIEEKMNKYGIELIGDYVSHFQSFAKEIKVKERALVYDE